jgi:hypothetical protein
MEPWTEDKEKTSAHTIPADEDAGALSTLENAHRRLVSAISALEEKLAPVCIDDKRMEQVTVEVDPANALRAQIRELEVCSARVERLTERIDL